MEDEVGSPSESRLLSGCRCAGGCGCNIDCTNGSKREYDGTNPATNSYLLSHTSARYSPPATTPWTRGMSTPRTTDATSPPHRSRPLPTQSRQPTLKLVNPSTPRHILLPVSRLPNTSATVCSTSIKHALDAYNSAADSRSPRAKHSMGKLTRATRSPTVSLTNLDAFTTIPTSSTASLSTSQLKGTVSPTGSIRGDPFTSDVPSQPAWLKEHLGNFVVHYDSLELPGFQLYAVEKWYARLRSIM